jgi:rhamnosyl/mannosyltransferase
VEKSETYGIVQIEAMACEKPVICTEIGTGTSFINQNGMTGLVVPPRDPDALAQAINNILTNSELRSGLGERGRVRAFNEFNSEKMVKRTYDLYRELLKDPS